MVLELAPDGQIQRLRPHLRPWLASTWFALAVGIKLPHQASRRLPALTAVSAGAVQATLGGRGLEVVAFVEILDEGGSVGMPVEHFLREGT